MREAHAATSGRPLRVGSLFSGYGGLDLAVEQVFDAETIWFSEISGPVARVFACHWPDAPNLGDITAVAWDEVEPVDVLCGGFPCQDVSTIGKRAGLAPGTRSGLWAHMATAIGRLQPEWVVIENVRGLLSAPAVHSGGEGDDHERSTPRASSVRGVERGAWGVGDEPARPLRALGAVLGDLADLRYDARWIGPAAPWRSLDRRQIMLRSHGDERPRDSDTTVAEEPGAHAALAPRGSAHSRYRGLQVATSPGAAPGRAHVAAATSTADPLKAQPLLERERACVWFWSPYPQIGGVSSPP